MPLFGAKKDVKGKTFIVKVGLVKINLFSLCAFAW